MINGTTKRQNLKQENKYLEEKKSFQMTQFSGKFTQIKKKKE